MPKCGLAILLVAGVAATAACDDFSGGRPADMGAGRPDTTQHGTAAETPAPRVLEGAGVGAQPQPGTVPVDTALMGDTAVVDSTARVDG